MVSEGKTRVVELLIDFVEPVSRPGFSLHFLLLNPISNLHFIFNPKYNLLFLNLSLFRFATLHSTKRDLKSVKMLVPAPYLSFYYNNFSISFLIFLT